MYWGHNKVNLDLLDQCLNSKDHKVRAAAVRAIRYNTHLIPKYMDHLKAGIQDTHGRVQLESITAASWLSPKQGLDVLGKVDEAKVEKDDWLTEPFKNAYEHLNGRDYKLPNKKVLKTRLTGRDKELYIKGHEVYNREGSCATCHMPNGLGIEAAGFPPISQTKWVAESPERLIKIVLNGLHGPITVKGKDYPGQVPMTSFGGILNDEEIAGVLTFVRNSLRNKAKPIYPDQVAKVREETKDKVGFYSPDELLVPSS